MSFGFPEKPARSGLVAARGPIGFCKSAAPQAGQWLRPEQSGRKETSATAAHSAA